MTKPKHPGRLKRRRWTSAELEQLRQLYADTPTAVIAKRLKRTLATVYQRAASEGLRKSEEYLRGPQACRLRRGDNVGKPTRFQPGMTPWNKGTHFTAGGRSAETRFRRGQMPRNWKPVGSYRVNADGYLDRKVSDTGYPPRDWVAVHRLVWIEAFGQIPPGHVVCFKPGRHSTEVSGITIDGVELVHRRDLMKRNTVHNLPKPLAQLVQLRGALVRKINARKSA